MTTAKTGNESGLAPLRLTGDGTARGRALGTAIGPRIAAHQHDWLDALAAAGLSDPREYVRAMLRDTDFATAIGDHAPDLLDEVRATSDAAGMDRELVFALNLIDEEWAYRARCGTHTHQTKCSSVGLIEPGGPTWIGQNMDLGGYTDGHQLLLEVDDGTHPPALLLSLAGVVALLGVNAAGVGICVNSLPQLPNAPTGIPVAFMIRILLRARTADEAAALCRTLPHATNQHYLIAGPAILHSIECSAAGATDYHPADPARVLHTNHPLSAEAVQAAGAAYDANSAARLASLTARLASGMRRGVDIAAALQACDDPQHPVCRRRRDDGGLIGFTTGSMLTALWPDRVVPRFSLGPPDSGYTTIAFPAGVAPDQ